jgi:hypothetical protein
MQFEFIKAIDYRLHQASTNMRSSEISAAQAHGCGINTSIHLLIILQNKPYSLNKTHLFTLE